MKSQIKGYVLTNGEEYGCVIYGRMAGVSIDTTSSILGAYIASHKRDLTVIRSGLEAEGLIPKNDKSWIIKPIGITVQVG